MCPDPFMRISGMSVCNYLHKCVCVHRTPYQYLTACTPASLLFAKPKHRFLAFLTASAVVSQMAKSKAEKTISPMCMCVCVCVWDWWQGIEVRPSGQRDKSYSLILQKRWTAMARQPNQTSSEPHTSSVSVSPDTMNIRVHVCVLVCMCFVCLRASMLVHQNLFLYRRMPSCLRTNPCSLISYTSR